MSYNNLNFTAVTIINELFLYNNSLQTLLHRCTTIVTEQCLVWTHKSIQMLKIEGAFNNMARDCIAVVTLKEQWNYYTLTILSLRGICESSFRSSAGSNNSPLINSSSFTLAPLALILRKTCRRREAKVSLLCVKMSTSSTVRPGLENLTRSARCFPLHALEMNIFR